MLLMKLADFDYYLPKKLIAQKPVRPRDLSRLLLLSKKTGRLKHQHFYDIVDYLQAGDVLVLNNSKVFPARLIGKKKDTGGKIEVLLHQKIRGNLWQCLIGGKGRREGLEIEFRSGLKGGILKNNKDGTWDVKFNRSGCELTEIIQKIGWAPLPPYIKRKRDSIASLQNDRDDYQTIYADDKKIGSVAAPTAGFHFTPKLIKKLKAKCVQFEYITLHVGLGTFAPVKVDNITKHKMHAEWVEVKKGVIERIAKAKQERRRIIAVGTTSVRTLEAIFADKTYKGFLTPLRSVRNDTRKRIGSYSGWVNIFIYPGYKFKVIDAMITNFHLPKSTLLMLVMAFASTSTSFSTGKSVVFRAYKSAIKNKYRFYSYGDAMFIY
jgi:S-adenosylmethionine:tRNA ribosyltransferase-isomerase